MKPNFKFCILFCCTLISACSSYKTKYSKSGFLWEEKAPASGLIPAHSMYLVGDAGYSPNEQESPVLKYLKNVLNKENENSSLIFLGDNIYQDGMPPKLVTEDRKEAEFRINAQLSLVDNFKGFPLFIPGNHDWRGWGPDGLKRQEKFVQKYINQSRGIEDKDDYVSYFLPSGGCSGPEAVELNNDVVIIAIDTQWWLTDWDKVSNINDGCALKNREHFVFEFENLVRKYRNKNLVIAAHHPMFTYGPHGGKFTIKEHLFPLTELKPNLYVPLPVLGSISAVIRGTFGSKQDVVNKNYQTLKKALLSATGKNGSFVFVSGHEHTLQHIEDDEQKFIISGSGSKKSPTSLGRGSEFASSNLGFSKMEFYANGQTWVIYYEVDDKGENAKLVYRKLLKDINKKTEEAASNHVFESIEPKAQQFVTTHQAAEVGKLHEIVLGKHNRNLYQIKYTFPTLDLAIEKGGLTPTKLGGGNQTNSLRLESKEGREYVLRGLSKDVTRFLPAPFNQIKAAKYVVEDNFMSTNPFAPLAIPTLADAIQVYHTNPKLVFVPRQAALDQYNDVVGGTMNLYEERPNGKKWKDAAYFGNPDKIVNTKDVLEEIFASSENRVDENWMLRTRMFDFLIGDWDRHDDQWAWAIKTMDDGSKRIRPIPKDRDQAFSLYDGMVSGIARQTMPFLRQLQSFEPDVRSVKWTSWSARLVDRTFLNDLDWSDWETQIKFIQNNLSDSVIESAFKSWPVEAQENIGKEIIANIKARRDNLGDIARKHYLMLGERVNILGTAEKERFYIDRKDNDTVQVRAYKLSKKGDLRGEFFNRTFSKDITKEIRVYGGDNDDEFVFTGSGNKGLKVRVIGESGDDQFLGEGDIPSRQPKTIIYDDKSSKNIVSNQIHFKDKRSSNYRFNSYDRRGADSQYDMATPLPVFGFNGDEGFSIGLGLDFKKYKFKKIPYSSSQKASATFAFSTNALMLNYTGDFIDFFRPLDLLVDAHYHGPGFAFNFAGLGNNTQRPIDDLDYYRVFQESFGIFTGVKKRLLANSGFFTVGPYIETSKIKNVSDSYIQLFDSEVNSDIFRGITMTGLKSALVFDNANDTQFPTNGFKFNANFSFNKQINTSKDYSSLKLNLAFYRSLDQKENIVFATQSNAGFILGTGYEFYQLASIGGLNGLRGYRRERFYGDRSYIQTTDLRIRLSTGNIPLSYGISGSYDIGKVWGTDYTKKWHSSWGGGIWFSPLDLMLVNFGLYYPRESSEESPRFVFGVGFNF